MMANDSKPMHELRFDAAVKVIQSLPPNGSFQPSNDMMLKFYSYYKQATQGPCDIPRPGFWDPVGKAKWDAWNSLGDMTKEDAMVAYVDEMKLILESMPVTDEVEELLHVLGPFYEMVDERKKITQVSDLTTARLEQFARSLEGFGSMLTSPPKSVTKSIVRSLVMNGSLESSSKKIETNSSKIKEQEEKIERETEVLSVALKGSAEKPTIHLSNGTQSLEHKASSLTNGTHSSKAALNSEDSEEELLHSPQPTEVMEINGYHSGHEEDKSSAHHLASDSDSEVYCDSVDQFGLEESSELLVNHSLETTEASHDPAASWADPKVFGGGTETGILLGKSKGIQHGGEDGKHNGDAPQRERISSGRPESSMARRGRVSRSAGPGAGAQGGLLGGGGDGERWGPEGGARGNLNEQIVTALARLQEDMQSVLQRLQTLEALTASQARSLNLQSNYPYPLENKVNKPSWWPFNVSPGTVAFAVAWPFVVQWLVRLYIQQRRRKMN